MKHAWSTILVLAAFGSSCSEASDRAPEGAGGSTGEAIATTTAALVAWPGGGWPDEVIVANNSLWIRQNAVVTGSVAVLGASAGPTLDSLVEASIGDGATLAGCGPTRSR